MNFPSKFVSCLILISCLLLTSLGHGGSLNTNPLDVCVARYRALKIIKASRKILGIEEPDAKNKIEIATLAKNLEVYLETRGSLEYMPHSVFSETHAKLDDLIRSREDAFQSLSENKSLPWLVRLRVGDTFKKIKSDSKALHTPSVRQADFLYFARNAARLFASIDKDGAMTVKGQKYASSFGGIYSSRDSDYGGWRKLSRESLLVPTTKSLSLADFNLASPYPIYLFRVADDVDPEEEFNRDFYSTLFSNSRFEEISKNLNSELFSGQLSQREKNILRLKISERLNFLETIYRLARERSYSPRQMRILAIAFYYTTHETELASLNTFSSQNKTLSTISLSFTNGMTHGFKMKLLEKTETFDDLKPVVFEEVAEVLDLIRDALKAALMKTTLRTPLQN